MVYVTGDLHGDISRLIGRSTSKLKKGDTLLICGDFGFIWDGSKTEEKILKKLSKLRFTILFVDGVHENFELLSQYPTEEYAGGIAQKIYPNIYHLLRGEIYTIEEKTIFAFGGGGQEEEEMQIRKEYATCWEQQTPSKSEMHHGLESLAKYHFSVDYIITHYPSGKLGSRLLSRKYKEQSIASVQIFLNQIEEQISYSHWYFGGYHTDKNCGTKHTAVFSDILPLN